MSTECSQDLASLAVRIQKGDSAAEDALYTVLSRGLRIVLRRQIPEFADDGVQEVLFILIKDLRAGRVRCPELLASYAQTVARRYVIARIKELSLKRTRESVIDFSIADSKYSTETQVEESQRRELMKAAFQKLSPLDREVLSQFYLQDLSPVQICANLQLSETQLRIRKNRAKDKLMQEMRRLVRPTLIKRMAAAAGASRV
jgi:RNA polymerase sigma factor (sigma-70 family)